MKILFALNISDELMRFKYIFDEVEDVLQKNLAQKNYGPDLSIIYVGWICVSPEYEKFFKERKPKYYINTDGSTGENGLELGNALEFEIILYYDTLKEMDDYGVRGLIYSSLKKHLVPKIKNKKIKNFDMDKFNKDLENVLK